MPALRTASGIMVAAVGTHRSGSQCVHDTRLMSISMDLRSIDLIFVSSWGSVSMRSQVCRSRTISAAIDDSTTLGNGPRACGKGQTMGVGIIGLVKDREFLIWGGVGQRQSHKISGWNIAYYLSLDCMENLL